MLLFLAAVVLFIYSNVLEAPFTFDDHSNIKDNLNIRLTEINPEGLMRAARSNRSVAYISFALNYYFHQNNVYGYHLVNILIHITAGIVLYFFSKTTLNIAALRSTYGTNRWIPFFTAFLWLVHPIQTQSVSYVIQRMNSLAAMFYILSLFLYAKARLAEEKEKKRILFTGCVFSGVLSFGSKEIAATLPLFIFLYEWYFFQDLSRAWLKRHYRSFSAILILLVLAAVIYFGTHPSQKSVLFDYGRFGFTLAQRLLTESRVVILYISLLIFPYYSRLNLDYDFPVSHSLFEPVTTLLSIIVIAALIGLAVRLAKRKRLISFCIFWFFGNLAIESSVIPLEIIYEHRTYLPSMLVVLAAVALAYRYIKSKRLTVAVLCAIATVFSVWTYQRNTVWSSDLALWSDCVQKSPFKERPHNNLGLALAKRGRLDEAISHYTKALENNPDYSLSHNNLGLALTSQGKFEEAVASFKDALRLKPDFAEAHNNLAIALTRLGRFEEAAKHGFEALRLKPGFAKIHRVLTMALAGLGRFEEAIAHGFKALKIEPNFAAAHYELGRALDKAGRVKEALHHFSEAIKIDPDFVGEEHYNMGVAMSDQGRLEEAIKHYSEALRIKPDHAYAHNNLGDALAKQGRLNEAISHYSEALRIKPDHADAHYNMGVAMMNQGDLKGAFRHYSEALRIKSDFAEAHYNMGSALAAQGRVNEAIVHYSEALRIKPDFAKAHYNMGNALARQRNYKEAIRHYSEALRIRPNWPDAHYNIGFVLTAQGRFNEASNHYSKALQIKPDHDKARKNLQFVLRLLDKSAGTSNTVD